MFTAQQATHLTRSIPSKASDSEAGSLVTTASLAIQTPCSLAPISAPQSQEGLLSATAWVFGTCSISIYVHCIGRENRKRKRKTAASTGFKLLTLTQTSIFSTRFNVETRYTSWKKKSTSWIWAEKFLKNNICYIWTFMSWYYSRLGEDIYFYSWRLQVDMQNPSARSGRKQN